MGTWPGLGRALLESPSWPVRALAEQGPEKETHLGRVSLLPLLWVSLLQGENSGLTWAIPLPSAPRLPVWRGSVGACQEGSQDCPQWSRVTGHVVRVGEDHICSGDCYQDGVMVEVSPNGLGRSAQVKFPF
jgi:hypothetical protein